MMMSASPNYDVDDGDVRSHGVTHLFELVFGGGEADLAAIGGSQARPYGR